MKSPQLEKSIKFLRLFQAKILHWFASTNEKQRFCGTKMRQRN
jgi:hypothetical protein